MGLFSKKKKEEAADEILVENREFIYDKKLGFYVGEMLVWERKTKIILKIKGNAGDIGSIVLDKIAWINDYKHFIIKSFLEEYDDFVDTVNEMIEDGTLEVDEKISEDQFVKALFVNQATVSLNGMETRLLIDMAAEPDYLMGHLAGLEIDSQYHIENLGLNG